MGWAVCSAAWTSEFYERAAQRPVLFTDRNGKLQDDRPKTPFFRNDLLRCHLNPETVPVTHFGTFTFGGSGICPHTSGMSAVATSRSLAMSLSSQ